MKVAAQSYDLALTKEEKELIILGIKEFIKQNEAYPENPRLMARTYEILANVRNEIHLVITAWDAEYILVPALNLLPVGSIDDSFYSDMGKIAKRKYF